MDAVVRFEQVSKHYRLRHNRPGSIREIFVRPWQRQPRPAASREMLWALRDVSFDIHPGETVGLVGPNGAGKSTALKLISRVVVPNAGRVNVKGRVAALLELGAGFHPDLSGRDNIFLSGALAGMSRAEIKSKFDAIVDFSELEEFLEMPVKHYSSGMFARLAFAVSVHLNPEIFLVDEVLAVGDQNFQQKCKDRLGALQREGMTICLVSHSLEVVRGLCTRAIWFSQGQIEADGAAETVVRHYLDRTLKAEAQRLGEAASLTAEQRWGTQQIEIVRVRLTGAAGQVQTIFETGQPLVVQMDYRAHAPIPAPVFGMAIHRQDGVHISGPNTDFAGLTLPTLTGAGQVSFTIPALPLLEGLYHVSVAVVSAQNAIYDFHDQAYPFRVVNASRRVREQYGVITLQGRWDLLSPESSLKTDDVVTR